MKKILLLFSVVGLLSLTGCNDDDYDENTVAEVFETDPLNFLPSSQYKVTVNLNPVLPPADMVLVYRLTSDADIPGTDVWELIPRTVYFNNGDEIDYDYNFTRQDILFYMGSNADLANYTDYTIGQIFRVVIVPGYASNFRTSANAMDEFKDYNATIAKYGIDDSNVKKLSVK